MTHFKNFIKTVALINCLMLPMSILASDPPPSSTPSNTVLATVNGVPIYSNLLESRVQAGIKKYKRFNKGEPPANLKQVLQKGILEKFIAVELIYQASQKEALPNLEKAIEKAITEYRNNNPDQTINEEQIKRQVQIDEYLKKYDLKDPKIPEKELRAFYEKNKGQFATKRDTAHVQHIIVKNDRNKIVEARQRILNGEPFSEVAKALSEDANAPQGGNLGIMERNYMPETFDQVAFSIPLNTLSDIIKTEHGYHILEVLERTPKGTIPPFENMKEFLAGGLTPQFKTQKVSEHIKTLTEQAEIEIFIP